MIVINMHAARTHLCRLVERASQGEEIVIAKAGKPLAKLVAYRDATAERKPGFWKGQVWMAPDFDVLPEDIAAAFRSDTP